MQALGGAQHEELMAALMVAFPAPEELAILLGLRLNVSLAAIAPTGKNYKFVVFSVIQTSEAECWTAELILAACAARPRSAQLAAIAERFGLVAMAGAELERMVLPRNGIQDAEWWRETFRRNERRLCRLEGETPTLTISGTAFLVGPDLLLTNFHVVEPLLLSPNPVQTGVRFDVRLDPDGETVLKGDKCALAEKWLLAASPHTAAKQRSIAASGEDPARLDYALLRLARRLGEEEIGLDDAGGACRGWVHLHVDAQTPEAEDQLMILQLPGDAALQVAFGSVVTLDEVSPCIRYNANTNDGSSGAPCFNPRWDLLALHQGAAGGANQGIAAGAIAKHIVGKLGEGSLPGPVEGV